MTLNEEVAVEVMGWEKGRDKYGREYWMKDGKEIMPVEYFKSDSDLNQARMVTEKGVEVLMELGVNDPELAMSIHISGLVRSTTYAWIRATAEQICQAVLSAVREARK